MNEQSSVKKTRNYCNSVLFTSYVCSFRAKFRHEADKFKFQSSLKAYSESKGFAQYYQFYIVPVSLINS